MIRLSAPAAPDHREVPVFWKKLTRFLEYPELELSTT
jgi:hypothetical protein